MGHLCGTIGEYMGWTKTLPVDGTGLEISYWDFKFIQVDYVNEKVNIVLRGWKDKQSKLDGKNPIDFCEQQLEIPFSANPELAAYGAIGVQAIILALPDWSDSVPDQP
jgi:hypothetical protein